MQFAEHLNTNCALLRAPTGDGGHAYTIVRAETVPFELDAGAALAAAGAANAGPDADAAADVTAGHRHGVTERQQQVIASKRGIARVQY